MAVLTPKSFRTMVWYELVLFRQQRGYFYKLRRSLSLVSIKSQESQKSCRSSRRDPCDLMAT